MLKIISGGQVGADRGGLDFALTNRIPCGGWCPKGRLSEDGRIPDRYPLQETPHPNYPERTEWNVRDSDGTVIFTDEPMGRGSALTFRLAERLGKPVLWVKPSDTIQTAVSRLVTFIKKYGITVLNVAGSRDPSYHGMAVSTLSGAWAAVGKKAVNTHPQSPINE